MKITNDDLITINSSMALVSLLLIVLVFEHSLIHVVIFLTTFTGSISLTLYCITKIKKIEIEKNGCKNEKI